ncbi:hypothetical protein [Streptococcus sobrinus]|uniref:hypothetical protein n=1 Tax=Streptococcus sobrinus TaxID=1310 RepID=UPI0018AB9D58|nr:hypothetical protein [Streptococcus sobrinus]
MPSVFNNDDLLRQIRRTTTGMDKAFKLENIKLDLGKVKDETGQEISGNAYLDHLVEAEKFDQAEEFISQQLKHLSNYQYDHLVDNFVAYLQNLAPEVQERNGLDSAKIKAIRQGLRDFKW